MQRSSSTNRILIRIPKGTSRRIAESVLSAMRPPPESDPHRWAEAKRILSAEGGTPKPGQWRSEPYQKPVLLAYVDLTNESILFLASSQGGGKTEILLCIIGYHIDEDPCPILVIEPSLEMAETLSKDRIAPMIAATPVLQKKVGSPRARDSSNTIRHKIFPGGHLTVVGANSPSGLSMRPIRVLLGDELRGWKASAGTEGDPGKLAEARQTRFWNRRRVYVSSPDRTQSRLWKLWRRSNQQEWFVPCPHCGHEQFLSWRQVRLGEKDESGQYVPADARYACEKCDARWTDVERWRASRKGEYRATAEFRGHLGFRLPVFAVIGRKLAEIVEQFLDAQGDPNALQVLTNTQFCEFYDDKGEAPDEHELMKRRVDYAEFLPSGRELPEGVSVLTAGIDVQADRIEYEITGWGRKEQSWLIRYGRIYGDVKKDAAVLTELDAVLQAPLVHAKGHQLYVRAACIDTGGHATQAIYRWVKSRLRRTLPNGQPQFVFGIKGRSEQGRPVWPESASRAKTSGPRSARLRNLWIVGVDAAKDQIYARLGIVEPGPGYKHFPMSVGSDYFTGLTAEQVRTAYRRGVTVRVWEEKNPGSPNEPLDCCVYSYAALEGLKSDPFKLNLELEVRKVEALEWIPDGEPPRQPVAQPRAIRRRMQTRGVER